MMAAHGSVSEARFRQAMRDADEKREAQHLDTLERFRVVNHQIAELVREFHEHYAADRGFMEKLVQNMQENTNLTRESIECSREARRAADSAEKMAATTKASVEDMVMFIKLVRFARSATVWISGLIVAVAAAWAWILWFIGQGPPPTS